MTALTSSFTDVYSSALRGELCQVVGLGAGPRPLPVATWNRAADLGDAALLDLCVGPTLDIGCGPGRMTQYLAERGHPVLGIDVVPEAVFQTRDRGVAAMLRDVFAPLPGEGRWQTALLADGNVGIGGDPHALLSRVADLIGPEGRVVVDLAAPGTGVETRTVRLETPSQSCRPFRWSVVGVDAIGAVARGARLDVLSLESHDERWFAVLTKGA